MVMLAILFGAFSFSFVVVRSHMAAAVVGNLNHPNEELVISGALLAIRGLAAVGSGYIAAAVSTAGESIGIRPGYGCGKWRSLIICSGVLMFGATIGAVGFFNRERRHLLLQKKNANTLDDEEDTEEAHA